MKLELLIDSDAFWKKLKPEILAAKKRVYIQTLSFEGDSVGLDLSESMINSKAPDKRIIVDSYTRHIINDTWIYSPLSLFKAELRQEVSATKQMIDHLNSNGVEVTFVNPFGFLYCHIPHRNHKKIIIVDDSICYIGGINFSEHNFAWHDMMMRVESDEATEFFARDFQISCKQKHFKGQLDLDDITFISLDGTNNEQLYRPFIDIINQASDSIIVHSPYLCHPFTEYLHEASGRNVSVTIISPSMNNKKTLKEFIQWESKRSKFTLQMYEQRMLHLKSMLIDNKYLVIGSCNFDYFSYAFEQEIIAIITNDEIIEDFKKRVIEYDLSQSTLDSGTISNWRGRRRDIEMRLVSKLMHLFN
ncbi:MAG: phosphatidylserine/phosphatidylglycerophosphate/cardiolipin synthase family protein [candidate division Zixibacteria bacterium]|nr:phosphatidylserine/phosphatidylglycerophosphate/cardiolipin synthase family protein [candidate division Zixibacteria bacterium]